MISALILLTELEISLFMVFKCIFWLNNKCTESLSEPTIIIKDGSYFHLIITSQSCLSSCYNCFILFYLYFSLTNTFSPCSVLSFFSLQITDDRINDIISEIRNLLNSLEPSPVTDHITVHFKNTLNYIRYEQQQQTTTAVSDSVSISVDTDPDVQSLSSKLFESVQL